MGHKVNPNSFRLVINRDWSSKWNVKDSKMEADWIIEEDRLRKELKKMLKDGKVSRIVFSRTQTTRLDVIIHTADPGRVRGQEDANLRKVQAYLLKETGYKLVEVIIHRIENPNLDAQLVAEEIARQIESRVSHKQAQKRVIAAARAGQNRAKGIKTKVSGRLGGNDMARTEGYFEGTVPLHTLKEKVTYGFAEAHTQYGRIGCKVWICAPDQIKRSSFRRQRGPRPYRGAR